MFGTLSLSSMSLDGGGSPGIAAPTAPVLSVVSVVGTTVTLSLVVDETIGEGDYRQVQIQADGGDWSSTIVDDTAALTSGEAGASELEIDIPEPDAGTYDVRMRVREGDSGPWSGWSNVDEYEIVEAPTLSNAAATATGETTASLAVDTDTGSGTLYWVVTTSATPPSAAQVKAGNDHTDSAAVDSGSQAVSGTGTQNVSGGATGLTAETAYHAYFMHEANSEQSNVATDSFTTDASADLPVPTYIGHIGATDGDATQGRTGINFGTVPTGGLFIIVGLPNAHGGGQTISSSSITPNAGSPIAGTTIIQWGSSGPKAGMLTFYIPEGTTGMDSASLDVVFTGNPFNATEFWYCSVPAANLSSQTPVDTDQAHTASGTVATVDIDTDAGGFYVALAVSATVASQSCTWTGDASPSESGESGANGVQSTMALASGLSDDAANTVTATFTQSGNCRIAVASFR